MALQMTSALAENEQLRRCFTALVGQSHASKQAQPAAAAAAVGQTSMPAGPSTPRPAGGCSNGELSTLMMQLQSMQQQVQTLQQAIHSSNQGGGQAPALPPQRQQRQQERWWRRRRQWRRQWQREG
jgi:hypothetical protein